MDEKTKNVLRAKVKANKLNFQPIWQRPWDQQINNIIELDQAGQDEQLNKIVWQAKPNLFMTSYSWPLPQSEQINTMIGEDHRIRSIIGDRQPKWTIKLALAC